MTNKNLVIMPPEFSSMEEQAIMSRPDAQALTVLQDTFSQGNTRHFGVDEVTITINGHFGRYDSLLIVVVEGGGFKGDARDLNVKIKKQSKDQQAVEFALQSGLLRKACEAFIETVNKNGWKATISVPTKIDVVWDHNWD